MSRRQLILFLKAPRPGQVKTRLAEAVGPMEACRIYETLVVTLVDRLQELAGVELRFAPDEAGAEVTRWLRPGWRMQPQGPGDLGARLERAFAEALASGAARVVIIGSDCPEVTRDDIESAWATLETNDLVLGPATDGGYWLIGLRAARPELLREMAWSTGALLAQTTARAADLQLRVALLRELSDVDTLADWRAYQNRAGIAATPGMPIR